MSDKKNSDPEKKVEKQEEELKETKESAEKTHKEKDSNSVSENKSEKQSESEKKPKKKPHSKKKPQGKGSNKIHPKFKPAPPLEKNPLINILDQHRDHKMRLGKIIAGISVLIIILFFLGLAYNNWKKRSSKNRIISNIDRKISIFESKMAESKGFARNQAIEQAIIATYTGERIDWKHKKKWQDKRKELFDKLSVKMPEKSKNFVNPIIALDMIAIPQGEFKMGRGIDEVNGCTDELPKRKVVIDYPFWMGKTEITVYQYRVFFPQYTTRPWDHYVFNLPTQPAVMVSWHLAKQYCEMLTYHAKLKGILPEGYVYRMPTEAEWEYACRAGTDTVFYWGDDFGKVGAQYANALDRISAKSLDCPIYQESPEHDRFYVTAPVASYKPNAFGLYDMSGNAWEWCWDWYNPAAYRKLPEVDPVQTTPVVSQLKIRGNFDRVRKIDSTSKVIRGGGCLSPPFDCRSATRDSVVPEKKDYGIGFRIVLAPPVDLLNSNTKNQ